MICRKKLQSSLSIEKGVRIMDFCFETLRVLTIKIFKEKKTGFDLLSKYHAINNMKTMEILYFIVEIDLLQSFLRERLI